MSEVLTRKKDLCGKEQMQACAWERISGITRPAVSPADSGQSLHVVNREATHTCCLAGLPRNQNHWPGKSQRSSLPRGPAQGSELQEGCFLDYLEGHFGRVKQT